MPARDMIIAPRDGHIDTPEGTIGASVALSVAAAPDGTVMLHVDVAGDDASGTMPFSVGIVVTAPEVPIVVAAMNGVTSMGRATQDWLN